MAINPFKSITSINSTLTLTAFDPTITDTINSKLFGSNVNEWANPASSLIGVPQIVKGLASNNAIDAQQTTASEYRVTLDGDLLLGLLPSNHILSITMNIEAPCQAKRWFDLLYSYQMIRREAIHFTGVIEIPGLGMKYTLVDGGIINWMAFPPHSTTLQALSYNFIFQIAGADGVLNA